MGWTSSARCCPCLCGFARETGIPLVATNDAHYLAKEDARMQHVLICIQTNKTVDDDDGTGIRHR